MSEDFDTVLRSQYSPGSTTLLYRRQLWLLRLKTTIREKKTVSKKFQVRLNCFLSHLFSFYFYLVFIIIIDMPPKAWRVSWTWWSWPALFNILRSLPKLQVEGKHSHSVGGSGGLYRFPECISWMIQCPQEHLLFCTLCESCTGFLRPPELRSGHRLKKLLSSSESWHAMQRQHPQYLISFRSWKTLTVNAAPARHPSSVSYSKLLSRLCCFIIDCWTDKLRCVSTLISGPPSDRLWLRDFHHGASWWLKPKTDY